MILKVNAADFVGYPFPRQALYVTRPYVSLIRIKICRGLSKKIMKQNIQRKGTSTFTIAHESTHTHMIENRILPCPFQPVFVV